MPKLEIQKIELIASLSDSKKIIDLLQRQGSVEISKPEEIPSLYTLDTASAVMQNDRFLSVAKSAREVLTKYAPPKTKITDMLSSRKEISLGEYLKRSDDADKILNKCFSINEKNKTIADNKGEIIRLQTVIESLKPWSSLDISFHFSGTANTIMLMGSFPKEYKEDEIVSELSRSLPQIDAYELELVSSEGTQTCIAFLCLRQHAEDFEQVLRAMGFSRLSDTKDKTPLEQIESFNKKIEALQIEIEKEIKNIESFADTIEDIDFLIDYFIIRHDKNDVLSKLNMSNRIFVLEGYVPKKKTKKLLATLSEKYDVAVSITEPDEDADVPILLENNGFSKPAEAITEMYSLPSQKDLDPTPIMAFFYYFFFGMMLSDAGYGLLMVILTSVAIKFFSLEEKTKNTAKMFLYCGISTMFWGSMYGSWFGDIVNVVRTDFLGLSPIRLNIWLDPVSDLMTLMVYCFIFGIVHLFAGVGIKAYKIWKDGKKFDAFAEAIPTYITIIGISPTFLGMFVEVPQGFRNIGKYLLIIGLVLVVLTAGRASKGIVAKLMGGFYGIYNLFSGYLGDVLSYSRLLALGLATGVIATVINLLGTIPQNTVVKALLLLVVFPVGHIANLAINFIGAYVHTNRLQFVEFFSKFYEGGGRAFRPLKDNTITYKIKEDTIND